MRLGLGLGLLKKQKKPQYYLEFDGVDDKADITEIDLGMKNLISLWVYSEVQDGTILGDINNTSYWTVWYRQSSSDTLYYRVAGDYVSRAFMQLTGGWHHLVLARNDTSVEYWLDNTLIGTLTGSGAFLTTGTKIDTIGNKPDASWPFKGKLDEISLFKYSTYPSNISDIVSHLYGGGTPLKAGNPKSLSNLEAYWKFNEGKGIMAKDSADSHDATLTNGVLWGKW